ncbi:unnamed protein product [Bursaphelenchus okinawaensis]|uniref:Uncharacterized protein n=1 Tax=Bursaphelenchus okinawaensis TaxID=465554 RepID=A0A811LAH4_9BILA|nr:unnamed protein product [Bursaphelenchus okinawaensis]CAG9119717.1 unnamed protein product [Bursaphelenchus okinawaensis]
MDPQNGAPKQSDLPVPPPPRSDGSQDSETSSNDFVKIDDSELRNVPEEFLTNYGNQVASDVLGSALADNWKMDERDLYVPEAAGEAETHPADHPLVDLDEFDPLAKSHSHDLEPVLEESSQKLQGVTITELPDDPPTKSHEDVKQPAGDAKEEFKLPEPEPEPKKADSPVPEPKQKSASPVPEPHKAESPIPEPTQRSASPEPEKKAASPEPSPSEPKEDEKIVDLAPSSPEPVDNVNEEVSLRRTSLLTQDQEKDKDAESNVSGVASQIEEAIQEAHDQVGDLLDDYRHHNQHQNEHSPATDSGKDVLGELHSDRAQEQNSGSMRELSPDLVTYDRQGPLTIPQTKAEPEPEPEPEHEPEPEPVVEQKPRPPTPPKDLSGPEEENPKVIDLGPPPHSHGQFHRQASEGLPSILKKSGDPWVDFKSVDPRGRFKS